MLQNIAPLHIVATEFRCGRIFYFTVFCSLFYESKSERIIEIGLHFPKLS